MGHAKGIREDDRDNSMAPSDNAGMSGDDVDCLVSDRRYEGGVTVAL